jgi:hypothetical protein
MVVRVHEGGGAALFPLHRDSAVARNRSCYGWLGWEGWKRECGEGCIQTKWPDVALDLDGAAEQGDAHDAPGRQARAAKVKSNLSLFLSI